MSKKLLKQLTGPYILTEKNPEISLSIVIPTLEEAQNIAILLERLLILLDKKLPNDYEIIVVDDDSQDQTWQKVLDFEKERDNIKVIRREKEKGLATAVMRGWQISRGKYLAVMDGDLQHPLEPLLEMLDLIEKNDLVVATRCAKGGGYDNLCFKRKTISKVARIIGSFILPKIVKRVSDPMSGYFMLKRSVIENIEMKPIGYKILLEVIARGRIKKITEVGYRFDVRVGGKSKINNKQYLQYVWHLLKLQVASWPILRLKKWIAVGLTGFAVDMFAFFILLTFFDFHVAISAFLSAEIAIINNFFWNDRWTFGDLAKKTPGLYRKGMRFWKFNLICLSGLLLHTLILSWMVQSQGLDPYFAKVLTIIIVSIWNIILNFRYSWDVPSQQEEINQKD